MSTYFPSMKQQLVTVPSSNFHFRASLRVAAAVRWITWAFKHSRMSNRFTPESLPTHKLFIYWKHMLRSCQQHVLSNCISFRSVFCLRSFKTFLRRFLSQRILHKKKFVGETATKLETIFKWSKKRRFRILLNDRFSSILRHSLSFSSRPFFAI